MSIFPKNEFSNSSGSNNQLSCSSLAHLNLDPRSSLAQKVAKTIGFVLLHVITLGFILLYHYLFKHPSSTPGSKGIIDPSNTPKEVTKKAKCPSRIFHLDLNLEDTLLKKVMVVARFFLFHIFTLGLPIAFHYATKHIEHETEEDLDTLLKTIDPDINPTTPKIKLKKTTLQAAQMKPADYAHLLPTDIPVGSLEAMAFLSSTQQTPLEATRFITKHKHRPPELNPDFCCSYPQEVNLFLADTLATWEADQSDDSDNFRKQRALLCLEQTKYLNDHYYIVDIPGDGLCFFRSYLIGWLTHLWRSKESHPSLFTDTIQRIQQHPFSKENAALTNSMVSLLQQAELSECLQSVYDDIFLSEEASNTAVNYLLKLANFVSETDTSADIFLPNFLDDILRNEEIAAATFLEITKLPKYQDIISHLLNPQPSQLTHDALTDLNMLLSAFVNKNPLLDDSTDLPYVNQAIKLVDDAMIKGSQGKSQGLSLFHKASLLLKQIRENYPENLQEIYTRFCQQKHLKALDRATLLYLFILTTPSISSIPDFANFLNEVNQIIKNSYPINASSIFDVIKVPIHNQISQTNITLAIEHQWRSYLSISSTRLISSLIMESAVGTPSAIKLYQFLAQTIHNVSVANQDIQQLTSRISQEFVQVTNDIDEAKTAYDTLIQELLGHQVIQEQTDVSDATYLYLLILRSPHLLRRYPRLQSLANELVFSLGILVDEELSKSSATLNHMRLNFLNYYGTCSVPLIERDSNGGVIIPSAKEKLLLLNEITFSLIKSPVLAGLSAETVSLLQSLTERAEQKGPLPPSIQDPNQLKKALEELLVEDDYQFFIHHQLKEILSDSEHKNLIDSLPSNFLIYTFLINHPYILERLDPQAVILKTFVTHYEAVLKSETASILSSIQDEQANNIILTTASYAQNQRIFLSGLLKPNLPLRQIFANRLENTDISLLRNIQSVTTQQAESHHVASLSKALGAPNICNFLGKNREFYKKGSSQEAVLLNLKKSSTNHGFLLNKDTPSTEEELPEGITLVLFDNHYACLIKKNS